MGAYVLSASQTKEWNDSLTVFDKLGMGDIYFSLAYMNLYADAGSFPQAYVYEDEGQLFFFPYFKTAIDQSLYEVPVYDFETAYGYGGPLSTSQDPAFLKRAWEGFQLECQKSLMIAGFIRFHSLLNNQMFAGQHCTVIKSNEVVVLNLPKSSEQVWEGYAGDTRTNVRKAQKSGVEILKGDSKDFLKKFYDIYLQTMQQVGAQDFYFFDERYFHSFAERLKDSFQVYLAQSENRIIGGALIMLSKQFVHYHLSANVKEHRALQPASLLRHAVIMDYLDSSKKCILFGGGGQSQASLMKFKAGFSKERADFYIGKYLGDEKIYNAICKKWTALNLEKAKTYQHSFLKYRF